MDEKTAITIIDNIRASNSFTMGLTLDEYVKDFRKRYAKMLGIILPNDLIKIAEIILEMNKEYDENKLKNVE